MKKTDRQDIDFDNKEICATEWFFAFYHKERPEGWTIEDEVMLLTLYLQRDIVGHASGTPIHTIMDWRQNVSKAINKTLDKLEGDHIFKDIKLYDFQEYVPEYEVFCTLKNFNGDKVSIIGIDSGQYPVLTDKGLADLEKDKMLHEAKELAKAELLREQEQAQKKKEATQKEVVVPLVDYGK